MNPSPASATSTASSPPASRIVTVTGPAPCRSALSRSTSSASPTTRSEARATGAADLTCTSSGRPSAASGPRQRRGELVGQARQVGRDLAPRCVAGDGEQRLHGLLQAADLVERGRELLAAQLEGLELDAHGGEGRPQLVRGVGAEGTLARDELVQARGGAVEGVRDGVELVHAGARCPRGEVTVAEHARGGGQPIERSDEAAREDQRRQHGERDQRRCSGREQPPGVAGAGGRGALGAFAPARLPRRARTRRAAPRRSAARRRRCPLGARRAAWPGPRRHRLPVRGRRGAGRSGRRPRARRASDGSSTGSERSPPRSIARVATIVSRCRRSSASSR